MPVAWLEWRDDPNAHTADDTYADIDDGKVRSTGRLVSSWLVSLTPARLAALVRER